MKNQIWNKILVAILIASVLGCTDGKVDDSEVASLIGGDSDPNNQVLIFKVVTPATIITGQCNPLIVSIAKATGVATVAKEDINLTISGLNQSDFYKDENCTQTQGANMTFAKGKSSVPVYIKPSAAKNYTLEFSDANLQVIGAVQPILVTPQPTVVSDLKLNLSGPLSFDTGTCKAYLVSLTNNAGASKTPKSILPIVLNGNSSGQFYAGQNCTGSPITILNMPVTSNFVTFSYRNNSAENVILMAETSDSDISRAFLSAEIKAPVVTLPSQLAISGPQNITSGVCSGPVVVRIADAVGAAVVTSSSVPFTVAGGTGLSIYSNASCTSTLAAPAIASGSSSVSFYYQVTAPGPFTLSADDGGALTDAAMSVQAAASLGGTATKLAVTGPSSVTVNQCSSAFVIKTLDGSNLEYAVNALTSVLLTGKGSGEFYSDASCTSGNEVSSVSFAAGVSNRSFYYKGTSVGALIFNASTSASLTPGSQSVSVLAGAPAQLTISGPTNINLGDCRAYVVNSKDSGGFLSSVSSVTPVDLTSSGSGIFYSDSACTTSTTSVSIPSGQSSAVVYFRSMTASTVNLSAADLGVLTSGNQSITIAALPAVRVDMTEPILRAGQCSPVTISLKDNLGGNVVVTSTTNVSVSKTGTGDWFSDAACSGGSVVSSLSIGTGQSSVIGYFKSLVTESVTLTAASSGLVSDSFSQLILPGSVFQIAIDGAATMAAGACIPLTVKLQDQHGNLASSSSSTLLTLTGQGSGRFSTSGDCGTTNPTVVVPAGASQVAVFYANNSAQSVTLNAASTGLTAGTLGLAINSGGATKLKWTLSSAASAGQCITGTLQVQDVLNNPVNQGSNLIVSLADLGSAAVKTSVDCSGSAVTSLTIPSGQNQVSFSLSNNVAESLTIVASSGSLSNAYANLSVSALSPTRLTLTGPAAIQAGECRAIDLKVEDVHGNLSPVTGSTTVNFGGLQSAVISTDSSCLNLINSTILASGSSGRTFYLKNNSAQNLSLTASVASGLTAASLSVAVQTLPSVALQVTAANSAAVQTCVPVTVTTVDIFNNAVLQGSNLTLDLLGKGSGQFYSNSGCTTTATQVVVPSGQSQVVYYFKSNVAESLNFLVQASGLNDGTKSFVSQALTSDRVVISGLTSISTGSCNGYSIALRDSLGNNSALSSAKTIVLAGGGAGGFYLDSSCSSSAATISFAAGQTEKTAYFKTSNAGALTFNFDDTGSPDLTAGTLAVSVTAAAANGGPVKLAFTGSSNITAGICAAYVVTLADVVGDPANASANVTVNLSGASSGSFYSNSACTTSASTVTIASGSSNATIYYKNNSAQSLVLQAGSAGLTSALHSVNVNAGSGSGSGGSSGYVPIKLVISGPADVLSDSCGGAYTISSADSSDQVTPVESDEEVTLTDGAGNGQFFDDPACTNAVTEVELAEGESQFTVYYKNSQAESVSLQAYSPSLIFGAKSVQVKQSGRLELTMVSGSGQVWQNFVYNSLGTHGTLSDRTVILKNVGLTAVSAVTLGSPSIATPFTFRGGSFPGLGGTCINNSTLLPNQQCTMVIRFQPSAQGSFASNLKVTYNVGAAAKEVNLPLNGSTTTTLSPLALAAGGATTCVTSADLSTKCFGDTSSGRAGLGNTNSSYGQSSRDIDSLSWTPIAHQASQIAVGSNHACGLFPDGSVLCWGHNGNGQLGTGSTITSFGSTQADLSTGPYVNVSLGTGKLATKIVAGSNHSCALLADGTVKCWGRNNYGQLGLGDTTNRGRAAGDLGDSLSAINLGAGQAVIDIAAGGDNTCAILTGGQLKCWGRNVYGQLGIGSTSDMGDHPGEMGTSLPNVNLGSGASILSVAMSVGGHACAILTLPSQADPVIKCWGRNDYGQLGIGDALHRGTSPSHMGDALAVVDLGISGVPKKLSLGDTHSCVLLATGSIKCWGRNDAGQLGLNLATTVTKGDSSGHMGNNLASVNFGSQMIMTDLVSGDRHNCALRDTGTVHCWGANSSGQLGISYSGSGISAYGTDSQSVSSAGASFVNNYSYYEGIATNTSYTCAIAMNKTSISCWGLASNSGVSRSASYASYTNIIQIEAGTTFFCVLRGDTGAVACWGNPAWYQSGGQSTYSWSSVTPLTGMAQIAAGENFLCGRTSAGVVTCLGANIAGVLGSANYGATLGTSATVNITIPGGGAVDIAAGNSHICARNASNQLYCWGYNGFGQLGDGTVVNKSTPTLITGVTATSMSLGRLHTCVTETDQSVKCWGDNQFGQLGLGNSTPNFTSPQLVTLGGTGLAKSVHVGEYSSCAIMSDDKLRCWGRNTKGELGIGTNTNVNVPTATLLGDDFRVAVVSAPHRGQHRCVIGWEAAKPLPYQTKCFGDNAQGQLGYADTADRGHNTTSLGRALLPIAYSVNGGFSPSAVPDPVTRIFNAYTSPSNTPTTVTLAALDAVTTKPTGVDSLFVKLWGGGGGGGSAAGVSGNIAGVGGTGGYVATAFQVTNNIDVYVAGGGGSGCCSDTKGGAGGGSSAIRFTAGSVIAIAGGGGGGGGASGSGSSSYGTNGGGAGLAGYTHFATNVSAGGGAGTTSAVGSAGTGFYAGNNGNGSKGGTGNSAWGGQGADGSGYSEGGGVSNYSGGGGGGYFGGGSGGAYLNNNSDSRFFGGGGGGGSNYVNTTIATSLSVLSGNMFTYVGACNIANPPSNGDPDYLTPASVGGGGYFNGCTSGVPSWNGGSGRVVLRYQ